MYDLCMINVGLQTNYKSKNQTVTKFRVGMYDFS